MIILLLVSDGENSARFIGAEKSPSKRKHLKKFGCNFLKISLANRPKFDHSTYAMRAKDYLPAMLATHKGGFTNVQMKSDLTNRMKAEHKKKGTELYRESVVQVQARVPYSSVKEVREAIEKGERDAPKLPFAASGVHSVTEGVILYTPKNETKGLLTGFRQFKTLQSRFVDGEGNEVSKEEAKEILIPSYFKKRPTKEDHAAQGTGDWRTPYLETVQSVGKVIS